MMDVARIGFIPPTFILECENHTYYITAACDDKEQAAVLQKHLFDTMAEYFNIAGQTLVSRWEMQKNARRLLDKLRKAGYSTDDLTSSN